VRAVPESRLLRLVYRWRVRTAFFAFLITLVLAKPTVCSILIGIGISLIGLVIRAWASGHLKKEKKLAVSGPYRYTRNPLYLGNLILGVSLAVGGHSWWVFGIFVVYFLMFYPAIIYTERERLKRLFPGQYDEYRRFVPLFFPFRKPWGSAEALPFSRALYRKNKEYRALIGAAVFWLIMAGKIIFHL
jgi:protein-S-isoprenylcysteine O-methyltransferase Ste14